MSIGPNVTMYGSLVLSRRLDLLALKGQSPLIGIAELEDVDEAVRGSQHEFDEWSVAITRGLVLTTRWTVSKCKCDFGKVPYRLAKLILVQFHVLAKIRSMTFALATWQNHMAVPYGKAGGQCHMAEP